MLLTFTHDDSAYRHVISTLRLVVSNPSTCRLQTFDTATESLPSTFQHTRSKLLPDRPTDLPFASWETWRGPRPLWARSPLEEAGSTSCTCSQGSLGSSGSCPARGHARMRADAKEGLARRKRRSESRNCLLLIVIQSLQKLCGISSFNSISDTVSMCKNVEWRGNFQFCTNDLLLSFNHNFFAGTIKKAM